MPYNALELTNLGTRIERARYEKTSQVSPQLFREWLTEAERLASTKPKAFTDPKLFATWGSIMSNLMHAATNPAAPEDCAHLAAFLRAATRLEPGKLMTKKSSFRAVDDTSDWNDATEYPAYDGLSLVTCRFGEGSCQGMLVRVLESGAWEPSALLRELATSLDIQKAYVSNGRRGGSNQEGLAGTALGSLVLALHGAMADSAWRPSSTPGIDRQVYELFWEACPYIDWKAKPEEEARLAKLFSVALSEFPEHGLKALAFVREKTLIAEVMLDAMLPMRFEHVDTRGAIAMVTWLLDMNAGLTTPGLFPEVFAKHHPELDNLMFVHFNLYPKNRHGDDYAPIDYMVGPWEDICNKTSHDAFEGEKQGLGHLWSDDGP